MLYVTAQVAVASVGTIRHDLGAAHAADPFAGPLLLSHTPDHEHQVDKPDPHSDYDGPPIEPDPQSSESASAHHHHYDSPPVVWILSTFGSDPVRIASGADWTARLTRLVGVTAEQADPPPRTSLAQHD